MRAGWMAGLVVLALGVVIPIGSPAGAAQTATVLSPALPLNVRVGPAVWYSRVGTLANGSGLALVCQEDGQRITANARTTTVWDRLADGTFVSDAYVRHATAPATAALPGCTAGASTSLLAARAAAPASRASGSGALALGAWTHPLPGFFTTTTSFRPPHIGVDLMSYPGTPIHAAAAGQVIEVVCNIQPGASCDVPGNAATRGCGWYVKIAHTDGITTIYCHLLRRPAVTVGQRVDMGQVIGAVGSSGNSSYPHLHFEVHTGGQPTGPENAVNPVPFMRGVGVALTRR